MSIFNIFRSREYEFFKENQHEFNELGVFEHMEIDCSVFICIFALLKRVKSLEEKIAKLEGKSDDTI